MNESKKIIIVDDHHLFRNGLSALIAHFPDCNVVAEFEDGKELVQKISTVTRPDIVLLDVSMPRMDGFETARWLTDNLPEIKILALSTMESESAIIRMIRNGARGYILKDCNPGEIKLAFSDIIKSGYYFNNVINKTMLHAFLSDSKDNKSMFTGINLSDRELQFLQRVCSEKTYKEIAQDMFLSARTIDGYRESLFEKLNIKSRVGLVLYAIKNNIINIHEKST